MTSGTRVDLEMKFEFANRVTGTLFEQSLFQDTAGVADRRVRQRAREPSR